ncbi:MAG: hypothetical protein OXB98_06015 [Bryobacterales bacterium]|nr:hypothetical protein [Bryobacterales bacterium]
MTIDMHRDTSIRKSVTFALFDSRIEELRLPSPSTYTATRNLSTDDLPQAVEEMETTLAAVPELKRKQQRRPGRFTKKPALCYTVYWEADYSQQDEISLIEQSLEFVNAKRLQSILIGRSDYPKRTCVIVNVVDPSSGNILISRQPYYELMRWHLSNEPDRTAAESLTTGMGRITIDSLRRQDHRLLDLPPQFAEAVRRVPGYNMDSATFRMVHRAGPSTFHTAEFIDTIHADIHEVEITTRRRQLLAAWRQEAEHRINHKLDTRRKILIGGFIQKLTEPDSDLSKSIRNYINREHTDPRDRSLFDLHTFIDSKSPHAAAFGKGLLVGFYPKKYKREWCAAFYGDPTSLPDDLDGYWIEIRPKQPRAPWFAAITEVLSRTDDKLIVQTTPRNEYNFFSK